MAVKSEYGKILTSLIKSKGMSQSYFYQHLKIAKPYFYDIVSGKVKPPPAETQIKKLENLDEIRFNIDYSEILGGSV